MRWQVELKHGRVAMLASVGFLVGEQFHPLWGGNINVPSYIAFQETPLQTFLPGVALLIAIHEVLSVFTFNSPFGGEWWSIRSDYASGDLGWDPLGLKPTDPVALKDMQTREVCTLTPPHLILAGWWPRWCGMLTCACDSRTRCRSTTVGWQ